MRILLVGLGIAMVLLGGLWALQGLGYVEGSGMSGVELWAVIGPIVAGLGVGLVFVAARGGPG